MKGGGQTGRRPVAEDTGNSWTNEEIAILRRWYPTLGAQQCVEYWPMLSGRSRHFEQIDNKARRLGIQGCVPDDVFELFGEGR